jgi:hypothetical protein
MTKSNGAIFCGLFLFFSGLNSAHAEILSIEVEPIVTYDHVQEVLPSQHTVNRYGYGGRVVVGVLFLSIESEYTHASVQESFPLMSQTDTGDRLKVGLRSGFHFGFVSLLIRGGAEAQRERVDQTVAGITMTTNQATAYNPYVGAGLRFKISHTFSVSANLVAVVPNYKDMSQNEYESSLGFAVHFP